MIKNIYYIKEFGSGEARNTFQAQIESIFDRNNFTPILYPSVNYFSRLFAIYRLLYSIPKGSIVFFIHPLYSKTNKIILYLLRREKFIPICIVSDINGLRFNTSVKKEISYWKKLKYFIFQNERMREFAEKPAGKKMSENIGLFDLLFETNCPERKNSNEIVFAGNTGKCPFLKDLCKVQNIQWHIYTSTGMQSGSNVHLFLQEDELANRPVLLGSYGLIWEGESIEDISGAGGQYLKIVSPLKLSNYLLNGLPVITHPDAAIAEFVMRNNIGFCVSSLYEAGKKIESIPETEYQAMVENTRRFSRQISEGYFTQNAIEGILNKMNIIL